MIHTRTLVTVPVNVSEMIWVRWDEGHARALFAFATSRGDDTWGTELTVYLSSEALRPLTAALRDDGAKVQRVELGENLFGIVAPRRKGGALLCIARPSGRHHVQRACVLTRLARRQLATGLDHARACAGDPTLLEDAEVTA